jgi:hypothetical protein
VPDFATLLKDAAAEADQHSVDVAAAVQRGTHLRRLRLAMRSGVVVLLIAVVPLLGRILTPPTVEFYPPADRLPNVVPEPLPTVAPSPDAKPERQSKAVTPDTSADVSVTIPDRDDHAAGQAATQHVQPSRHAGGDAGDREAAARDTARPRADRPQPAVAAAPAPSPSPQPSPSPDPDDRPRPARVRSAPSCELYGSQLQPGTSASCKFRATHHGGYVASGSPDFIFFYRDDVHRPPVVWRLKIVRADEVIRINSFTAPSGCQAQYIEPGDVVTAWVYRPKPPEWTGYVDLEVGLDHGAGCTE